ncbi:hypothetical protein [Helicovermis profundi]|uniref:Uncharacterized protein n=1 Tax=Helicovermis profundi TaxID=3065157 RepID=A0AAU9EN34_9FIRM|nr:hypothetical protein HLPR_18650 [Clostridia bacterium S502]
MSENNENENYSIENTKLEKVLSVPMILFFLLIMAIPIINLLMSFRWSFKKNINKNLKNLSRVFFMIYIVTLIIYVYIVIS